MEERKQIKFKDEIREMNCSEVYEQFKRLNYKLARHFLIYGDKLEDLFQIANVGLVKAFNSYIPNSENLFSTYLRVAVNFELLHHLRNLRKSKYEPSLDHCEFKNNERVVIALLDKLADPVNYEEIALHLTMIADIEKFRGELNPIAREIIECFYFKNMTQCQIGKILNYSQVQISRILKRSLKILKNKYEIDKRLVVAK